MPPGIAVAKAARSAGVGCDRPADRRCRLGGIGRVKLLLRLCRRVDVAKKDPRSCDGIAWMNLEPVKLFQADNPSALGDAAAGNPRACSRDCDRGRGSRSFEENPGQLGFITGKEQPVGVTAEARCILQPGGRDFQLKPPG